MCIEWRLSVARQTCLTFDAARFFHGAFKNVRGKIRSGVRNA